MKNKSPQKPPIFEHLDVRSFLLEYYQYKKATSRGFSYEVWAQKINIKSRSLLRMVVTGKRPVTDKLAQALQQGLGLKNDESKYFSLLVAYSRARGHEQKKFFMKQMSSLIQNHKTRQEISNTDFLSSHWLPKIQTLLSYKDIQKTSKGIASLLGIDPLMTHELLEKLVEISGVQNKNPHSQDGTWNSSIKNIKIPEAIQNVALRDFYIQAFEDAKKAIALPPKTRKFRSLLIPLSETEYSELLEKLEEAFQDILSSYDSDELQGRRLYQLTTSLVPLTK